MTGSFINSTCDLQFASAISIATFNIVFSVVGIIGNFLVCFAVYSVTDLRTLSNAYLVVLAIADFFTSALAQPILTVMVIREANQKCDKTLETVFRIVGNFSCAVSFLVLCSITTERFLAVVKPIVYRTYHAKQRFYTLTSISLTIPLIYTILRVTASKKGTSYFSAVFFVIGYVYILSCYLGILVHLRRHSNKMAEPTAKENTKRRQAEKAVTATMAIVIGIFTIMWVPFFYFRISKPSTNSGIGYNWVRTTAMINSALNPIVYALRLKKFKNAYKHVINTGLNTLFTFRSQASTSSAS